jgi:HSP20 family protein
MRTMNRLEQPFRGATTPQEQMINRVFGDLVGRTGEQSNLTPWAPAVDIYETEHELVVKADLPEVNPQDLDIHVENNILTIRGERKFENKVNEENYLRIEREYGSFSRTFSLANSVNSEAIKADYQNGVLTLTIPKREEAKPKQIKVNVGTPALAAAAGARKRNPDRRSLLQPVWRKFDGILTSQSGGSQSGRPFHLVCL